MTPTTRSSPPSRSAATPRVGANIGGFRAYVTNTGDNTVSAIDTNPYSGTYNHVIANILVGSNPSGVAVNPDDYHVYVTNTGDNTVSVIDTDPDSDTYNQVIATIPVGSNPSGVAADDPNFNSAYVANTGDNTMSVIDTATNTVSGTVAVGGNPSGWPSAPTITTSMSPTPATTPCR